MWFYKKKHACHFDFFIFCFELKRVSDYSKLQWTPPPKKGTYNSILKFWQRHTHNPVTFQACVNQVLLQLVAMFYIHLIQFTMYSFPFLSYVFWNHQILVEILRFLTSRFDHKILPNTSCHENYSCQIGRKNYVGCLQFSWWSKSYLFLSEAVCLCHEHFFHTVTKQNT